MTGHLDRDQDAPGGRQAVVDVVVPVYADLEKTAACLRSVLENEQATPFELVVVNDAGPEPELHSHLEELAEAGSITLLDNEVNIGFVDSANLGMMLHPDRDVVLLNSDTEVNSDWLDRLRRCVLSDARISTATPFSNNATLASYPLYMAENRLPDDISLEQLDEAFSSMNREVYVEIPTAVGFCTYITRRSIDSVGYLDSLHFGRGYGEENDFSMRAIAAGFKHLLCGDVFVFHSGGGSFGSSTESRKRDSERTLELMHPGYWPSVAEHCSRDPERPLRRAVDLSRLTVSGRAKLLFITHHLGGGTEKHIRGLAGLLQDEFDVLALRPSGAGERDLRLEWLREGEDFHACFPMPGDIDLLADLLRELGVVRVHFHHTVRLAPEAYELPERLGVPYDFTVHDYYTICPFTNLIAADDRYCGEPDLDGCMVCFASREAPGEQSPEERRRFYGELLEGADRVIAPSEDSYSRMQRYFPGANLVHVSHPDEEAQLEPEESGHPAAGESEIKVLVLGEMSPAKGLWLLQECAADATSRGLPLCFRVLGRPLRAVLREPEIPLSFSGPYEDRQLMTLIQRERADLIFFPARWPETYSFTLTTALRSGLPLLAPRLGAFSERMQGRPGMFLADWDMTAPEWNDMILSLAKEQVSGK